MSRLLVCLALSTSFSIYFMGAAPAGEEETPARPLPSTGQAKILAALSQPTEFDFEESPLGEVVNYFKQKHEIEILLDSKALSDAGIGTDAPITETQKKISLRSALRLLLGQLDLTYVARDGYLLITSKTEAESMLSFKVYPVQDLVTLDSDFRPAPPKRGERDDSLMLSEVIPVPRGLGGFPGGAATHDERGDFPGLIETITSTAAPTTWDEVGGPGAITANPNSQAIAVSQTDEVHEDIVELLAALRRVRDEQTAAAEPLAPQAPPEASETKKPFQVHAYRLMRGTTSSGKGGWRPPAQLVGDSKPPRGKPSSDQKPAAPEPSGEGSAAKKAPPANEAETKGAVSATETADQGAPAKPKDEKLAALAEKIATLVPQVIEPQSWEPSGEGMIRAVGDAVVVRHTDEVQRRVAGLIVELLPDCVPLGFTGPWGPWKVGVPAYQLAVRLCPATTANWPQRAEPVPCAQEVMIHEALLEKCNVEFDQLPLVDALRLLAKPRQVQVYIDHRALTDAGVGTDTPVTCSVNGVSYRAALKLLLDELDLAYLIRDEVLVITSKTEAENTLSTKVYPVFDLVVRPPNATANGPALNFESLINSITSNIAPTTWDEVGGPGAIKSYTNSGALVISQTLENHEEIAEYLRALREVGAAQKQQHADASR